MTKEQSATSSAKLRELKGNAPMQILDHILQIRSERMSTTTVSKGTNQKEENIKQSSSSLKLAEITSNAPMHMLDEIEQKHLEEKSDRKEKMAQNPSDPSNESRSSESGRVRGISEKLEMYLKIGKAETMEEAVQYMKKACPGITDEEAKKRVMNIFNM